VQAPGAPPSPGEAAPPGRPDRAAVLAQSQRVRIASDRLHGSIRLTGGQFDDLTLADYHEQPDRSSPEIKLLSPTGAQNPYFAQFGWVAGSADVPVPTADTKWTASDNTLSPGKPVTFTWDN